MANAQLAELHWVVGQSNNDHYSRTSYHRIASDSYDPEEALKYAAEVGIVNQDILSLPMHLISTIYPRFEEYGVAALVEEYANTYSKKAASISLVKAEKYQLLYCYYVANAFGMPDLVLHDNEYSSVANYQIVKDVESLISHIIRLWPYYETKPFLCPGSGMIFTTSKKKPNDGVNIKAVRSKDFAELVHSLPDSLLGILPPHIQAYAALRPPVKSILLQSPEAQCAYLSLFSHFDGSQKPERVR